VSCGSVLRPIREDGECFNCHIRGIGFTFVGGAFYGREGFHTTRAEAIEEHVGVDRIRSGDVERMP
jgi:hypothetical protein